MPTASARHQPDSLYVILPRWLPLACLACAALFRVPKPWKNFSGPKKIFLPPASFAT
jgi:hypothetical protein